MTPTTIRYGRRPIRWFAIAAAVLALAACGRGADSPSPSTPSGESTASSASLGTGIGGAGPNGTGGSDGAGGSAGAGGTGSGEGAGDNGGAPPGGDDSPAPDPGSDEQLEVAPAAEYCISHHPEHLYVTAFGNAWSLRDDVKALKLFDTKQDAEDALKVARNWKKRCVIGTKNQRPDKFAYLVSYWREPSGLPLGTAPNFDCISYNPAQLAIHKGVPHPGDPTQLDWALYSGATPLLYLDTVSDALRAQLVAADYTRLCFIGRANTRDDPAMFILHYWR